MVTVTHVAPERGAAERRAVDPASLDAERQP
jgi:hypothetical protein